MSCSVITPITPPFAASAASAAIFIRPTLPPPYTSVMPRAASARPKSAAACAYAGRVPTLEPQKRQTRFIADTPRPRRAAPASSAGRTCVRRHSTSSALARPLLAHEVVDFARREPRAEVAAEIRRRLRASPSTIVARVPCRCASAEQRSPADRGILARAARPTTRRDRGRGRSPPGSARLPSTRGFISGKVTARSSRSACSASLRYVVILPPNDDSTGALGGIDLQHVVARDRRRDPTRRRRTAAARRCKLHTMSACVSGALEIRVGEVEEVLRLVVGDVRMLERLDRYVGGADQRVVLLVGNHEHDAVVGVLQDVRVRLVVHARHHDVAALDVAHVALAGLRAAARGRAPP